MMHMQVEIPRQSPPKLSPFRLRHTVPRIYGQGQFRETASGLPPSSRRCELERLKYKDRIPLIVRTSRVYRSLRDIIMKIVRERPMVLENGIKRNVKGGRPRFQTVTSRLIRRWTGFITVRLARSIGPTIPLRRGMTLLKCVPRCKCTNSTDDR